MFVSKKKRLLVLIEQLSTHLTRRPEVTATSASERMSWMPLSTFVKKLSMHPLSYSQEKLSRKVRYKSLTKSLRR
jgi:hypothetical protein